MTAGEKAGTGPVGSAAAITAGPPQLSKLSAGKKRSGSRRILTIVPSGCRKSSLHGMMATVAGGLSTEGGEGGKGVADPGADMRGESRKTEVRVGQW
jgi:hypothetical protein